MRELGDDCVIEMALPDDVVMAPLLVNDEARWIYSQYLANRSNPDQYNPMYFLNNGPKTEHDYFCYIDAKKREIVTAHKQIQYRGYSFWGEVKPL